MTFRKKRDDTKIGNVSSIPDPVLKKYRDDAHLGSILNKEHVTSLHQLKKKYSKDGNC